MANTNTLTHAHLIDDIAFDAMALGQFFTETHHELCMLEEVRQCEEHYAKLFTALDKPLEFTER